LEDHEFLGFATYLNASEPLFMLSGDQDIGTLFPVWSPPVQLTSPRFHTVRFAISISQGAFYGSVPDSITVKYGSEIDLMGYGDEEMFAYGLHFGGWSADPNFQTPIPRIVVLRDMTVYAVWYSAKLPYNKPKTYSVIFGNGTILKVNHSSVLRLVDFNPDNLTWPHYQLIGWNTDPNAAESLFHLTVWGNVFL